MIKRLGSIVVLLAALAILPSLHAQGTVVFSDKFTSTSDLDSNWCATGSLCSSLLGGGSATAVTCPSASPDGTTTCVQIPIGAGAGNNLLDPCWHASWTGCTGADSTFDLTSYGTWYTRWHVYIPSNASYGSNGNNAKFAYIKNSGGGNVCYWDLDTTNSSEPQGLDFRTICDNATLGYIAISATAGWHTLEAEYSSSSPTYQIWFDGSSAGSITPTTQTMTSFQIGLYTNTNPANSWNFVATDFAVCTGGRCPSGSTPAPSPSFSPTSLTFPTTNVGTNSATQTVTLTNNGTAAYTFSGPAVGTSNYTITSTTCSASLAASASCTITVQFNPTTVGALSDSVSLTGTNFGGGTQTVPLSGTGTSTVVTPPAVFQLGKVSYSVSGTRATIAASLTDTAGVQSGYTIWGNGAVLKSGTCSTYPCSISWSGATSKTSASIWIDAYDSKGNITSAS